MATSTCGAGTASLPRRRSGSARPRCTSDGEFELTADWLGVTGPKKVRFDGDLRPPYRLRVHVTEGPAEVRRHHDPGARRRRDRARALGPRDVKESLWQGGQVAARVQCVHGRFRAVSLAVPPTSLNQPAAD